MFFWRLLSITFLIIGLFLFVQSLILQNITFFYFAIGFYCLASLIWLTIQKLYVEPFTYKKPLNQTQSSFNWLSDIANMMDFILSLPKIVFLFLIRIFYN